jgi:archaellin
MNMPTKQTIIDNIDSYTPENLVDFIQKDIIAYSDIIKEASCSHTVRESVKDLLEKAEAEAAKAEAEAWTALQANPTLDAAENFLKTYQQSSHREDVLKSRKGLMDDAAWNAVNQTDISSLETFVNNNAGNSHIGEAQTKIEELQWNKVDKTDISALVTFITNNAGNSHIGEAQTKIEELQWNAVDKKNPTALSDFINKYPSSTHKQDAVNLLNDAMCYKSLGGVRNALINEIVSAQTDPTISDPVSFVVDTVERYINGGIITKKDFVEMLSEDNNLVNTSVLNTLKGDKILQPQDFLSSGFDQDFVNMLMKNPPSS